MAHSTLVTAAVLFAVVTASSCLPGLNITHPPQAAPIQFNSLLVAPCTKDRFKQSPECTFNWHNTSIWVGGVVPGPKDDITIDGHGKIFTLACTGLCTGRDLNTTAKTMTIKMSENASVTLDTWTTTNLNFVVGGAFDASEVTVISTQLTAYLSFEQVTKSSIESIDTESFYTNLTTIEIYSIYSNYAEFYSSEVTVNEDFDVGTIWNAIDSELYFLGECESSEFNGNGQTFRDTYMYSTTACQYPLSQDALFINTQWKIVIDDSPSVYFLPDWITLELTEDSTIYLDSPIELHINTTIHGSDGTIERFDGKTFSVLYDNGHLSGHLSFPPLKALGGVIEANTGFLYVTGELYAGPNVTIYIKDTGYLLTLSVVLDQPALNYSSAGVKNIVKFNEGKLTGSFGSINMNHLPYVLDYNDKKGYIAAVLPDSPVSVPVAPPVASTPVNNEPVIPPQEPVPVAPPQSQTPITETPQASGPEGQPIAVSSPSSSNLAPTAVTDNSTERTLNYVLAIALVAAVIVVIVLGVLYHRAKRRGYQIINNAEYHN